MAIGEAEITSVVTSEPWNPGAVHQQDNFQAGLSNTEPDEVGAKRAKLLRRMCIITLIMLLISAGSIIVGVMAFLTSDSKIPYVMGGGAISGGMAFLYVLCASYVYFEGKKTKTGTKMTSVFTGCRRTLTVWFFFLSFGLGLIFALSGIWGTIKCYRSLKKTGYLDVNPCLEHMDEKFLLSILTMVLSSILFALSLAVMCVFTCNTKLFGLKSSMKTPRVRSLRRSRYEHYEEIRQEAREQAFREMRSEMNAQNNSQGLEVGRYVEPTAPPLNDTKRLHDQRQYDHRDHRGWPHDERGYIPRPQPRQQEQDRLRDPSRSSPLGSPERGKGERVRKNEEPPPRYEDVVKDYTKLSDV